MANCCSRYSVFRLSLWVSQGEIRRNNSLNSNKIAKQTKLTPNKCPTIVFLVYTRIDALLLFVPAMLALCASVLPLTTSFWLLHKVQKILFGSHVVASVSDKESKEVVLYSVWETMQALHLKDLMLMRHYIIGESLNLNYPVKTPMYPAAGWTWLFSWCVCSIPRSTS